MLKFKVFTDKGHWTIEAETTIDAFRLALYYAWRDGEIFQYMQCDAVSRGLTYHLAAEDKYGVYKVSIP